jgi:hypothetical protein
MKIAFDETKGILKLTAERDGERDALIPLLDDRAELVAALTQCVDCYDYHVKEGAVPSGDPDFEYGRTVLARLLVKEPSATTKPQESV